MNYVMNYVEPLPWTTQPKTLTSRQEYAEEVAKLQRDEDFRREIERRRECMAVMFCPSVTEAKPPGDGDIRQAYAEEVARYYRSRAESLERANAVLKSVNDQLRRGVERLEAAFRQALPKEASEPTKSDVLARCMKADRPLDGYGR